MAKPPPRPSSLEPEVPVALGELILRLLAKDPAQRPASAEEVRAELKSIAEALREAVTQIGHPLPALAEVTGPPEPLVPQPANALDRRDTPLLVPSRPAWRRRRIVAAACAGLLLLTGVVLWVGSPRGNPDGEPSADPPPRSSGAPPEDAGPKGPPTSTPALAAEPAVDAGLPELAPPTSPPSQGGAELTSPPSAKRRKEPSAATARRMGQVTLKARPQATVFIDGKRIGQTPLSRHALPAGVHHLVLRTQDGRERRRSVQVQAGKLVSVYVDFGN